MSVFFICGKIKVKNSEKGARVQSAGVRTPEVIFSCIISQRICNGILSVAMERVIM